MEEQNQYNSEEQQNKDNEHSTFVALVTTISIFALLIFMFNKFLGIIFIITSIKGLIIYYFSKYIQKTFGTQALITIWVVILVLFISFVWYVLSNICFVCGH